jgi:hypothetical protein
MKLSKLTMLIIFIFLIGLYVSLTYKTSDFKEGFTDKSSCPNILIQKGDELYLYNSRRAKIPGVNPVKFNNLEDYVEFVKWQRSQNIKCPVLFMQHSYDTQGKPVYKIRPSPTNLQGGLPNTVPLGKKEQPVTKLMDASRSDSPYNKNSYPGFDAHNQYEGLITPLDKMFHEKEKMKLSDNPMDNNWGGVEYTKEVVDSGVYDEDNVSIYIP